MLCSNLKYPKFSHNSKCVVSYIPHLSRVSFLWRKPTSEQAIQLLAPIFYSVRARGFCCCPVDSAVPFYQKLILLFFEKEGICCGRCLPVKAKLFCPEIAGLFCRIAGLFCHDSRANLSLKPVCFGIAIS